MSEALSREELAVQDAILQFISSNFVSVKDSDKKYYNKHLGYVVNTVIERMKEADVFFGTIFQRHSPAGSFWDGLKIGKPAEFDLNFVLKLPSCLTDTIKLIPASPSFVVINVQNGIVELEQKKWEAYRKISGWLDRDGNILADKVRSWMESVLDKAVKAFSENEAHYKLATRKAGPAITLQVQCPDGKKFDVDIVPAFEFQQSAWPKHVKACPTHVPHDLPWHLVPKPIRPDENVSRDMNGQKYTPWVQWRMSFHNQESFLIYDKKHLKAVLKLLKKMRDIKLDQNLLCSYAIKTIFLWEMDDQDDSFWRQGLSVSFLHMLRVINEKLKSKNLPFYWEKEHNLLNKLKESQRDILSSTFQNIYNQIQVGLKNQDWFIIARVILSPEEYIQTIKSIMIDTSNNKVVARLQ